MARPKKEESAKKKRLAEKSALIGEPENIFDVDAEQVVETKQEEAPKKAETVESAEGTEEGAEEKVVVRKPRVRGKKLIESRKLVKDDTTYTFSEAVELLKKASYSKFDGTVELHITLTEKEQRGTLALPHGTGKTVKVFALVPAGKLKDVQEAGADQAGDQALIEEIKSGKYVPGRDFNALVADPSMMPALAPLARSLGPKGLMPNPKNGTVGPNAAQLVQNLKKGQVNFKAETPNPYLVHMPIGKVSYSADQLTENYNTVVKNFGVNKVKRVTLSATMSPGIKITLE